MLPSSTKTYDHDFPARRQLTCFCNIIVMLVYFSVAVDKYKNQTADHVKKSDLNTPKVVSANPLDNLDCKRNTINELLMIH